LSMDVDVSSALSYSTAFTGAENEC
jgi:hypothetical protein